jgi:MFS family permease
MLSPLVGYLVDRWEARKTVIGGVITVGLGLLLLGRISNLAMFYISFILISMGLTVCGGGLSMTLVGNWFRRNVSLATGIALSGSAIGGLLVIVLTKFITLFHNTAATVYRI